MCDLPPLLPACCGRASKSGCRRILQTRLTVPLFQRPYVWSQEEQPEPLWDDLSALADRVLAAGGETAAGHFLSTVVLEQVHTPTGSIARREVIDGHQRQTTLEILLKAAQHALGAADGLVARARR